MEHLPLPWVVNDHRLGPGTKAAHFMAAGSSSRKDTTLMFGASGGGPLRELFCFLDRVHSVWHSSEPCDKQLVTSLKLMVATGQSSPWASYFSGVSEP